MRRLSGRKNMPVSINKTEPVKKECGTMCAGHGNMCAGHHHAYAKKIVMVIFAVFLIYAICYLTTLIRLNTKKFDYVGKADKMEHTIVVSGYGKVTGNNDIAVTSIGYSNTDKDVAKAQADNKKVMDQVFADLKKLGVEDKDLQSNYTIYPDYNYTQQKGQELVGYRVTNSVTVKIRDLSKIPDVLSLAGKYGATEVSGLNFTIDDPENLKGQARDKALADAKVKAIDLARNLGLNIGSVVSYYENEGVNDVYAVKSYMSADSTGMGGGPAEVAGGSKDVVMNVSVTYEIK
jgi:uncharacterized protein YggE